jgi:hypothetical protein
MSFLDELLEEILFLKNAGSKLKYKYFILKTWSITNAHIELLPEEDASWINKEEAITGETILDEFYSAINVGLIQAFYYNEVGNFFTASWEYDKEKYPMGEIGFEELKYGELGVNDNPEKLKDLYKKYSSVNDFNKVYGSPFEYYKGFNISPSINIKLLNSIEVNMIKDDVRILFNRNIDDLMIFAGKTPISSKIGVFSNKWTLSERGIISSGNKGGKTTELKVKHTTFTEVIFNSSVSNFPQLLLAFRNDSGDIMSSDFSVAFLGFLAEFEMSTREKSTNFRASSEEKINPFLPHIENLENNSLFPALDLGEGVSYVHSLETNGYNRDYFFKQYERIISSRKANIDGNKIIFHPDIAQYFTIIETDKILIENGMKDYGLFEVTGTNHPDISKGVNFYSFDENDNLLMMSPPYQVLDYGNSNYILFDSKLYNSNHVVCVPKSEIVSYKLYGTELMQSTVSTDTVTSEIDVIEKQVTNKYQRPSITGTLFSSLLFGSTYTLLNGVGKALHNQTNILGNQLGSKLDQVVEAINNISITTTHKIIDTSRVQVVLTNRRDLEIDGINIFYDLNRIYPNLDKLKSESVKKSDETVSSSTNLADEILKIKQLLDQGVIDEDEFKLMKKKILN